jgi:hypothetical protein
MKIKLTKTAKQELKKLTKLLDEKYHDDWPYHSLKVRERLLLDAQLYVDEAYIENSFTNLDVWCKKTGLGEVQKDHLITVKKKIGKMLIENIITITE